MSDADCNLHYLMEEQIIAGEVDEVLRRLLTMMEETGPFGTLILMGFDAQINVYLAWAYVGLRVVHSLIQATVNIVIYRFIVFTLSSLCLIGLTAHAAIFLIHHG